MVSAMMGGHHRGHGGMHGLQATAILAGCKPHMLYDMISYLQLWVLMG